MGYAVHGLSATVVIHREKPAFPGENPVIGPMPIG